MIFRALLLAAVAAMFISNSAWAGWGFDFEDHPIHVEKQTWKNAIPNIHRGDEFAWMFRTRVREAAKAEPNFANHFVLASFGCDMECQAYLVLASFGCGTECQVYFVVNTKTGEVIRGPVSGWGAEGMRASNLLVVNPIEEDYDGDMPDWLETEYYVFDGKEFHLVFSEKPPSSDEDITGSVGNVPLPMPRPAS